MWSGQVLKNTKLMTYGILYQQSDGASTKDRSSIGKEGEVWIQSNASFFKPVKEKGSYEIQTIAGGRSLPLKVNLR